MVDELPDAVPWNGMEALYRANMAPAVRLAFLVSGDAVEAEDLAHDAFLRCATRARSLRSPDAFRAYLQKTVTRLAVDRHRSRTRRMTRERTFSGVASMAGEASAMATVAATVDVLRALDTLRVEERAAVVLRYWLDWPEQRIADALGCRPGTVKSRLARALGRLKGLLDE